MASICRRLLFSKNIRCKIGGRNCSVSCRKERSKVGQHTTLPVDPRPYRRAALNYNKQQKEGTFWLRPGVGITGQSACKRFLSSAAKRPPNSALPCPDQPASAAVYLIGLGVRALPVEQPLEKLIQQCIPPIQISLMGYDRRLGGNGTPRMLPFHKQGSNPAKCEP